MLFSLIREFVFEKKFLNSFPFFVSATLKSFKRFLLLFYFQTRNTNQYQNVQTLGGGISMSVWGPKNGLMIWHESGKGLKSDRFWHSGLISSHRNQRFQWATRSLSTFVRSQPSLRPLPKQRSALLRLLRLGASYSKSWEYPLTLLGEYGGTKIIKIIIFLFSKFLHLPLLFWP